MQDFDDLADAPQECYICRDPSSLEPLVQPCRCQGSIAGVHASCIEAWICARRREGIPDAEYCQVCRVQYIGASRSPGMKAFVRELGHGAGRQFFMCLTEAARIGVLGFVLSGYVDAAMENKEGVTYDDMALYIRSFILPVVALHVFLLYDFAVLMVSLPMHRMPPIGWLARQLFTQERWCIARREAELLTAAVWIGFAFLCGKVKLLHAVPAMFAAIMPVTALFREFELLEVVRELCIALISLPWACREAGLTLCVLVRENVWRLANLLDGISHVLIALTAIGFCIGFRSRGPVTALFLVHSAVLVIGLVERTTFRCLPWRDGSMWWFAWVVGIEATNLALDCQWLTILLLLGAFGAMKKAFDQPMRDSSSFIAGWCFMLVLSEAANIAVREFRDGPEKGLLASAPWRHRNSMDAGVPSRPIATPVEPRPHAFAAKISACTWLLLLGGLACSVNSRRCYRSYRSWQRRHATFVLQAPGRGRGAARIVPVGTNPGDGNVV